MKPSRMAAMILSGLVLFYPLSIGPVARFYEGRSVPGVVHDFYLPLMLVIAKDPRLVEGYIRYLRLWGVDVQM